LAANILASRQRRLNSIVADATWKKNPATPKFKAPLTRRGELSAYIYIYYIYECERACPVTSIVFAALQKLSKKQRRHPDCLTPFHFLNDSPHGRRPI
jgi:hypothetical protein